MAQQSMPAAFGAERGAESAVKVTLDLDLASDVCWLNGAGRSLGGNWEAPEADTGSGTACATLSGGRLSPRVRNVRYVSIYLVDTALSTAGSALAAKWGGNAYGAHGVYSLVARNSASGWLAVDDVNFYKAQRLPHADFHDGPLDLSAHAGAR